MSLRTCGDHQKGPKWELSDFSSDYYPSAGNSIVLRLSEKAKVSLHASVQQSLGSRAGMCPSSPLEAPLYGLSTT